MGIGVLLLIVILVVLASSAEQGQLGNHHEGL